MDLVITPDGNSRASKCLKSCLYFNILILSVLVFPPTLSAMEKQSTEASASKFLDGKVRFVRRTNPQLELCQLLDRVLKRHQPYPRMMCPSSLPLPEDDQRFHRVRWEHMDIDLPENRRLATRLYLETLNNRQASTDRRDRSNPVKEGTLENMPRNITRWGNQGDIKLYNFSELLDGGLIELERARLDINFDGREEEVYRLGTGQCQSTTGVIPSLLYTLHVVSPAQPSLEADFAAKAKMFSDVFLFNGRPYLVSNIVGLVVSETKPANQRTFSMKSVCTFTRQPVSSH